MFILCAMSEYPPTPSSGQPPAPSAVPPSGGRPGSRLGLGLALGVVLTVAVGAVLYATDVINFKATESASVVDTAAPTLPDRLGAVVLRSTALDSLADKGKPEQIAAQKERAATEDAATAAALSKAYGGAGATVRSYADTDLLTFVNATAVRADSPRLFVPREVSAADLGLAINRENIVTDGEVDCLTVQVQTTVAGKTPDPANTVVSVCQRTASGLTVRVYPSGGQDNDDEDRVATAVAMTNELWDAVAGSAG